MPERPSAQGPSRDVTVSWMPCICNPQPGGAYGHRTIHCWHCHSTWYDPPHIGREWIDESARWKQLGDDAQAATGDGDELAGKAETEATAL